VYASSSSVYGNAARYPSAESDLPRPHSPYGVTKLAAEHLCRLYADNWGVSTVSLRFFTVYGPRQRPDMAIHRLVEAGLDGREFTVFGDGQQVRDFTFVEDVVDAVLAAAGAGVEAGTVLNVAGGSACTVNGLIEAVGAVLGQPVTVDYSEPQPGDVDRTGGAIDCAATVLGWKPRVDLAQGLARQVDWHRHRRAITAQ
jgi:nucleoside-diphosphate-sugar epimerase